MKLSKIKEIPPRTYWHNEATDFTPWLAEEDNLAELSEVIYLDLELVSIFCSVHNNSFSNPFSKALVSSKIYWQK